MRMILAAASLALLAASGGSAGPAPSADPELVALRAQGIAGCSAEATSRSPPGTDVARLCGCAVDSLMAGKTAAELPQTSVGDEQRALNACAVEQGVTLTAMPDSPDSPAEAGDDEGNSVR